MQPTKYSERKKRILSFAGLYAASVILLFFIFSAFGVHLTSADSEAGNTAVIPKSVKIDNAVLRADSSMHSVLNKIQQADERYALLPATTSPDLRTNAVNDIALNEALLRKTIDSLQELSADLQGTEKASLYNSLLASFKSILKDRLATTNAQSFANSNTALTDNQQDVLKLKNLLDEKETELARAQQELKNMQGKNFTPTKQAGDDEAKKGEIDLLKTAFNDQQKDYQALQEKYNRIKTENGNLASQLIDAKKANITQNENTSAAADNKINTLQQKVQDLNAEIYFTRIDCNLSRADAQQIISNARQRKELLSESLTMLNTLASSGNEGIQKKAKEKIIRLNHIATSLHD